MINDYDFLHTVNTTKSSITLWKTIRGAVRFICKKSTDFCGRQFMNVQIIWLFWRHYYKNVQVKSKIYL